MILIRAMDIFWQTAFWSKGQNHFRFGDGFVFVTLFPSFNTYQKCNWMKHHSSLACSPVILYNVHNIFFFLGLNDCMKEISRYKLLSTPEIILWMGVNMTLLPNYISHFSFSYIWDKIQMSFNTLSFSLSQIYDTVDPIANLVKAM